MKHSVLVTKKAAAISMVMLFLSGCASNYVGGFNGERRWFNSHIAFFDQQRTFAIEYGACQSVARGQIPAPHVAFAPSGTRFVNGSATIWTGGTSSRVTYSGTISDPSANIGAAIYNIGSAFSYVNALGKAEVACVERLGWVSVPGKHYTPQSGNSDIPFNRAFLRLVREGYSDWRIAQQGTSLLLNKSNSFRRDRSTYELSIAVLMNNAESPAPTKCNVTIEGTSYSALCEDGSGASGLLNEDSVYAQFAGLIR